MAEEKRVNWEKTRALCTKIFMARGVPEGDAFMIADNLVSAELDGVYSHGIERVKMYLRYINNKQVNMEGDIIILDEGPATLHIDGNNCLGAVAATKAVRKGIEKVKESGAVVINVCNSNHFGTAAYYTQMIAKQGMLGIAATNAFPHVAPWGSSQVYLGTNPISFGVPTASGKAMVLDMATSVVARGKISVAAEKGESIPLGWALDSDGKPTTDAKAAIKGALLPIAGPKGYGLSLFIDVLTGVLSGSAFGGNLGPGHGPGHEGAPAKADISHFFVLADISRFMPLDQFEERIGTLTAEIKALPKMQGVSEIYLPGEIEQRKAELNKSEGLMLSDSLLDELKKLCEQFGIEYTL